MRNLYEPEAYVVCRCLVDNSLISRAISLGIQSDDFTDDLYRTIWDVIERKSPAGQIPSPEVARLVVRAAKGETGMIAQALAELPLYAPTAAYFEWYASEIIRKSVRRQTAQIANQIAESEDRDELDALTAEMAAAKGRLSTVEEREAEATSIDLAVLAGAESDTPRTGVECLLMPTRGMDDLIGGPIGHGSLVVVAAASGNFKSTFLLQMFCRNAADHDCVFLSLEMNNLQVGQRLRAMGHGQHDDAFLVTRPSLDVGKLIGSIESLTERGYDTFAIDYGQLVEGRSGSGLYEKQTAIANAIQDACKRLGVTIIVATQLRKQETSNSQVVRPPSIEDIRDTGRWREAGDVVILLDKVYERYRNVEPDHKAYREMLKTANDKGTSLGQMFIVSFAKMRDKAKPYEKYIGQISDTAPLIEDLQPANFNADLAAWNQEDF